MEVADPVESLLTGSDNFILDIDEKDSLLNDFHQFLPQQQQQLLQEENNNDDDDEKDESNAK